MNRQEIIMNFSAPPSLDDLQVIANGQLELMPDELSDHIEDLAIQIEDMPDDLVEAEMELEDPYELLALFKSGKQISPGVEKKSANDDDVLILYRRPILDMWCESGEDLTGIIREIMIEELATNFEFSDDDIEEMTSRHYQSML
ncbi:MAG: metallopeptidase family protein [Alphaproteobacteria bacterium]|nr:metallopeptidase family protein [Alphaproteobacteria bacterium]NCQ88297.1 metallopeptidase family protein [Alphaproteobacteria bacterium]NCT05196.1 metallopeptidase family protein [Alphaproteobacteria bacterium]